MKSLMPRARQRRPIVQAGELQVSLKNVGDRRKNLRVCEANLEQGALVGQIRQPSRPGFLMDLGPGTLAFFGENMGK